MRALLLFPILHSLEDLGSMRDAVDEPHMAAKQTEQFQVGVDHFWSVVASTIDGFGLDFGKLKLYQDGLPLCGKETEIVTKTAQSGSKNFLLLQSLMEKGATIIGTESPDLLLQEYALMRQTKELRTELRNDATETARGLLEQRDTFIAQRISTTLKEGEMGLLFIGLLHKVEEKLPQDITAIHPIGKPAIGA